MTEDHSPTEPARTEWTWPSKGSPLVRFNAAEVRLFTITVAATVSAGIIAAVMLFAGIGLYRLFQHINTSVWGILLLLIASALYIPRLRYLARRDHTKFQRRVTIVYAVVHAAVVVVCGLALLAYVTLQVR
jgi:hypothetical protein